jgi:hypothetical protein
MVAERSGVPEVFEGCVVGHLPRTPTPDPGVLRGAKSMLGIGAHLVEALDRDAAPKQRVQDSQTTNCRGDNPGTVKRIYAAM